MSKDSSSSIRDLSLSISNPFGFVSSILAAVGIFFLSQLLPIIFMLSVMGFFVSSSDEVQRLFEDSLVTQATASILIAATSLYFVYRFLKWRGLHPFKFIKTPKRLPSKSELLDIVAVYGVYFFTLVLATVLLSSLSIVNTEQTQELGIASTAGGPAMILVFLMLVVLPPISEEVLVRGFLFNKLKNNSSLLIASIATSVLFGAAHLEFSNLNWIAAVDTFIFSLYLIYVYQKHESLYSPILLHALKNGIAFCALFVFAG